MHFQPRNGEEMLNHLKDVPGWSNNSDASAISRTFMFPDFTESIAFIDAVARLSEEQHHHPKITIDFKTVTLTLTTHSTGGLTDKDFKLAEAINSIRQ